MYRIWALNRRTGMVGLVSSDLSTLTYNLADGAKFMLRSMADQVADRLSNFTYEDYLYFISNQGKDVIYQPARRFVCMVGAWVQDYPTWSQVGDEKRPTLVSEIMPGSGLGGIFYLCNPPIEETDVMRERELNRGLPHHIEYKENVEELENEFGSYQGIETEGSVAVRETGFALAGSVAGARVFSGYDTPKEIVDSINGMCSRPCAAVSEYCRWEKVVVQPGIRLNPETVRLALKGGKDSLPTNPKKSFGDAKDFITRWGDITDGGLERGLVLVDENGAVGNGGTAYPLSDFMQ